MLSIFKLFLCESQKEKMFMFSVVATEKSVFIFGKQAKLITIDVENNIQVMHVDLTNMFQPC